MTALDVLRLAISPKQRVLSALKTQLQLHVLGLGSGRGAAWCFGSDNLDATLLSCAVSSTRRFSGVELENQSARLPFSNAAELAELYCQRLTRPGRTGFRRHSRAETGAQEQQGEQRKKLQLQAYPRLIKPKWPACGKLGAVQALCARSCWSLGGSNKTTGAPRELNSHPKSQITATRRSCAAAAHFAAVSFAPLAVPRSSETPCCRMR